jgi:hypothetical protein
LSFAYFLIQLRVHLGTSLRILGHAKLLDGFRKLLMSFSCVEGDVVLTSVWILVHVQLLDALISPFDLEMTSKTF